MTDRVTMRQRLRLRSHARSIAVYTILVGLPVLGLLAILRAGQHLEAAPPIGGSWRVESGASCGLAVGDEFTIVQSGQFMSVSLADRAPLQGRFANGTLRAQGGARESYAPGCSEGQLELVLRLSPESARLVGTAGILGCAACPPRPISAIRTEA